MATPIGNLADISLRALHVLQLVDCIACEDTRHTQGLLRSYGIDKTGAQLLALHQHNEHEAAQTVVARLKMGQRIAYVSDAGTPGISDPGARLVATVHGAGLRAIPLPGASSITAVLSIGGALGKGGADSGFVFAGFLPTKAGELGTAVEALSKEARSVVLLEAPHRIADLAKALSALGQRQVTLGRELTKQYEEIVTLPADEISTWLSADSNRTRGEFVVMLHPATVAPDNGQPAELLKQLLPLMPLKTAVRISTDITGVSRNAVYEMALALRQDIDLPR